MSKSTLSLSDEQYVEIVRAIREGFPGTRPNERVATALLVEANLGIRISDVVRLRLSDVVMDGERFRLDIIEKKTQKARRFSVPAKMMAFLQNYCIEHSISKSERIFSVTERQVQRILKRATDYLEYDRISTHSFRKYFATRVYNGSNYNIALVQTLLQHSSPATTRRYIGIGTQEIESALIDNLKLI